MADASGASDCPICRSLSRLTPDNPYFIAELETGYAVLSENQHIAGYTLFVSKTCVSEPHELAPDVRARFLDEMADVAEAVYRAFTPRKLNYELLGNSVAHAHWHLFPRYDDDPNPQWPVWNNQAFMDAPRRTPIEPARLQELRERVRRELAALSGTSEPS